MAEREETSDIDFESVIRNMKPGNRGALLAASAQPQQQKPEPTPPTTEPMRERESPREESKRRKNRPQDYESLFFKAAAIKTRSGKVVYIRKEHHDRLMKIVRVIGENEFTLFNYLDNILENHFSTYQDEITELYNKKHTEVFPQIKD